ncbi:uncharacterized protein LOC103710244 isoform X2 [Phoenix dactylifera]|uniref:Uncharacterized protein LOC103710244 isoform X2 n=1 Tax=Phoenix dactylifera TaxID=42345 RepID=A0A8B9ARE6_PHODC|nr:uncharacterized protein LOC103710244 isoform X2 [Phoenix dactylifera]
MERFGCTIEMEPRTLSEGELNDAREAAVAIIQSKEPKEALSIFTQGKSLTGAVKGPGEEVERQGHGIEEGTGLAKKSWNLPCGPDSSEEFPDGTKLREPLSSPF